MMTFIIYETIKYKLNLEGQTLNIGTPYYRVSECQNEEYEFLSHQQLECIKNVSETIWQDDNVLSTLLGKYSQIY